MTRSISTSYARVEDEIVGSLARRHSTATVLLHHAIAERLGLGPTDHKCLDLLHERGSMSGSELAAITGLTSGAVTGVVNRLERAGHVRREPDPHDRRKQILRPAPTGVREVAELFDRLRADAAGLVEGFDEHQLAAIAEFLSRGIEFAYHRTALLRTHALANSGHTSAATTATTTEKPA